MTSELLIWQQSSGDPSGTCHPGGQTAHAGTLGHAGAVQFSPAGHTTGGHGSLAGAEHAIALPSASQQVPAGDPAGVYAPGGQLYVQVGTTVIPASAGTTQVQLGSLSGQLQTGGTPTTPASTSTEHAHEGSLSGHEHTVVEPPPDEPPDAGPPEPAQLLGSLSEQQVVGSG